MNIRRLTAEATSSAIRLYFAPLHAWINREDESVSSHVRHWAVALIWGAVVFGCGMLLSGLTSSEFRLYVTLKEGSVIQEGDKVLIHERSSGTVVAVRFAGDGLVAEIKVRPGAARLLTDNSVFYENSDPIGGHQIVVWPRPGNPLKSGQTVQSATANLVASAAIPEIPVLIGPTGNTSDTTPTFSWNPTTNAARYELWVASREHLVLHELNVTATSYTPSTILASGRYRFWIRAYSEDDVAGEWSDYFEFAIR